MIEQFDYDLNHTPCENVVKEKRLCGYQENVQNLFPLNSDLTKFDIQSYLGVPLLHIDGTVIGILVVMNDKPLHDSFIAESILKIFSIRASAELIRLLEEKKLKLSEQNLQTLIHTIPDIVIFKDGEGKWIEANNATLQLFELEQDTYKGKTNIDFHKAEIFHKESFLKCEATDQEAWKAHKTINFEEEITRSNGTSIIVEFTKVPVFDHMGNRQWLIVIGRDITDRKLVQDNLKGQNDILENERLNHFAAPNLPESFIRAIDGIQIGPAAGSCGTAAFCNTNIVVSDIENDPLWDDYREIAIVHGLKACWSVPITD